MRSDSGAPARLRQCERHELVERQPGREVVGDVLADGCLDDAVLGDVLEARRDAPGALDADVVAVGHDDDEAAAAQVLGVLGMPAAGTTRVGGRDGAGALSRVGVFLAFGDVDDAAAGGRCDHGREVIRHEAHAVHRAWAGLPIRGALRDQSCRASGAR